jgi:hypothetical protein
VNMKWDKRWLIAVALIGAALVWRMVNWNASFAPGLELVTASTLVAAVFLPRRAALVVPLAIMVAGDILIGNTSILLFTWTAFALIGMSGWLLRRPALQGLRLVAAGTGAGVGAAVFFFLFTNFGVWLLGDGTMYAKNLQGLGESFLMGLPFLRANLIGNLMFVPAYFAAAVYGPAAMKTVARALWRRRDGLVSQAR